MWLKVYLAKISINPSSRGNSSKIEGLSVIVIDSWGDSRIPVMMLWLPEVQGIFNLFSTYWFHSWFSFFPLSSSYLPSLPYERQFIKCMFIYERILALVRRICYIWLKVVFLVQSCDIISKFDSTKCLYCVHIDYPEIYLLLYLSFISSAHDDSSWHFMLRKPSSISLKVEEN